MAWMTGWLFREAKVVSPSSGAGTGYQVAVPVTYAGLANLCRTDFGDVRFTASDGSTELVYKLLSKTDGVSASFLVKVTADLSSTQQTIYLYFGNPDQTTTSSNSVYDFFDDATADGSANYVLRHIRNSNNNSFHWDSVNKRYYFQIASTYSIDMWEMQGITGNNIEVSVDFASGQDGWSSGVSARYSSSGVFMMGFDFSNYFGGGFVDIVNVVNPPNPTGLLIARSAAESLVKNTWYTVLARTAGASVSVINTGTGKNASATSLLYPSGSFGIFIAAAASNTAWFKNIIVRHYVSPEPAVSTTGPIETVPGPANIKASTFLSVYAKPTGEKWQTLGSIESAVFNLTSFMTLDSYGKNKTNGAYNFTASCKMKQCSSSELLLLDSLCNGKNDFLFKLSDAQTPAGLATQGWVHIQASQAGIKARVVADGNPNNNRHIELSWQGAIYISASNQIDLLSPTLSTSDFESSSDSGTFHGLGVYSATTDGGSPANSHLVPCGVLSVELDEAGGSSPISLWPIQNVKLIFEMLPAVDTIRRNLPNTIDLLAEYEWMATDADDLMLLDDFSGVDIKATLTMIDDIKFTLDNSIGIESNFETVGDTDKNRVVRFTHKGRIVQSSFAGMVS